MSVRNGQRYLRAAVDSILAQTLADLEFIIVDDASTDESGRILREYASCDRRVVVLTNHAGLGLTRSLNLALARATGDYLARMDADDISLPCRFERQVAYLNSHPDVGVVGSFYTEIDADDAVLIPVYRFPVEPILVAWRMAFENPLPHPPILARRSVITAVGGYDERWETSQDYDLFTRMAAVTKLANCPEVLFLWRRHRDSVSTSRNQDQRANALSIARAYVSRLLDQSVSPAAIELLWRRQPDGAAEACEFVSLATALCRRILTEPRWRRDERRLLRRTVGRRLVYELTPYLAKPEVWRQVWTLALISPASMFEAAARKLRAA